MEKSMARMLGIDYGTKRIGIAVSDELNILARGLCVIERKDEQHDIAALRTIIEQYTIDHIIIGVSKHLDGSLGIIGKETVLFAEKIKTFFHGIIVLYDEAMTTRDAAARFHSAGKKTKQFKKDIDQYAAEIILQEYLSQQ